MDEENAREHKQRLANFGLAEIEEKEDEGNEAATIDDIIEDEEKIGADKTKKEDEAANWKPKSR